MKRRDYSKRLLTFARTMRTEGTDAERKLWPLLRAGRADGLKFRRQHPLRGYILDFYCEEHRLAVELDGEQHTEPAAVEYDRRRTQTLQRLGVRVLRFSDHDVLLDPVAVANTILRVIRDPLPNPPPEGEGVR